MRRPSSTVELVAVGDELLSGRVVDTNSAFIGRALADRGLDLLRTSHIHDQPESISGQMLAALGRASFVIVMGGLGPTEDDRTLDAVAGALGRKLRVDRRTLAKVQAMFRRRGTRPPKLAERQARVIVGARLIPNPAGMVPGMIVEHDGRFVLLLPGVPAEMRVLLPRALDLLAGRLRTARRHSSTIRTFGTAEAAIAEAIGPTLRRHPDVSPAYYPSTSGVDIVLNARVAAAVRACAAVIVRRLGTVVYEVGARPLEQVVGDLLRARGLSVGTAESCTGGLVAARLSDLPGSSEYFAGGVVAYANGVKAGVLGVATDTLRSHGAVSLPVAAEMAAGVRELLKCDVGISVTGIAGPGGVTRTKPIGLVLVAVSAGRRVWVERKIHAGTRQLVRERSASAALDLCRRVLEESV
ncbi:MAG: CinA family nicotinamide mononucleotide deamidase-related protein [bacterium]